MERRNIGFDIGGTKCAMTVGELGEKIEIVKKEQFLTDNQAPKVILERFAEFIDRQKEIYAINGIGISCGGPLDGKNGIIKKPPSLPLWDNIEIVKFFEERFNIPTCLQNDANACAVAEWKYGAGRGCDNMVFLTFGTGLGAGLILNGKLYSGSNDNAGEVGHIRISNTGPVGYNKKGSIEGFCSGSGIQKLAFIMAEKDEKRNISYSIIKKLGKENLTAKILAKYAFQGDEFALKVYKKSGEILGKTLSMIIDMLNPQKIIIGGVFMRSQELLIPYAKKVILRETLSCSRCVCDILPAGLGENIGDVAALSISNGNF